MKSNRSTTILALTLPALSLVLLSAETGHAASIVRTETWIGRLPEPKGLKAVKLKRPAVNHWVRFEAPAVPRRGTLTLSSGTLQFIKGSILDSATHHATTFRAEPLTLAGVEIAGSAISNIQVASVEDGSLGKFTLANTSNTSEWQQAAAVFNQLPFEQSITADLVISDNLGGAIAANSISTVDSSASATPLAEQGAVPVPEPSVAALSALAVTGLLARRRRR